MPKKVSAECEDRSNELLEKISNVRKTYVQVAEINLEKATDLLKFTAARSLIRAG